LAAKLKLKRMGAKKKPIYRLVVIDESRPTTSVALDTVGRYEPRHNPPIIDFNADKIKAWLAKGAQPTDKVRYLLGKMQILSPLNFEGKVKRKSKKEAAAAAEAAGAKPVPATATAPAAEAKAA